MILVEFEQEPKLRVLINPAYVIAIHEAVKEGISCLSLVSNGEGYGNFVMVKCTPEEAAKRLRAGIA
jgi:hypothetical protein